MDKERAGRREGRVYISWVGKAVQYYGQGKRMEEGGKGTHYWPLNNVYGREWMSMDGFGLR